MQKLDVIYFDVVQALSTQAGFGIGSVTMNILIPRQSDFIDVSSVRSEDSRAHNVIYHYYDQKVVGFWAMFVQVSVLGKQTHFTHSLCVDSEKTTTCLYFCYTSCA